MPRLRHTNGAGVTVPEEKVDGLLRNGFTRVEDEAKPKAAAKKSSSSKSSKK